MFDLQAEDLTRRILAFPAGLSSFNAELTELGGQVVSGDPHYGLSLGALKQEMSAACEMPDQMDSDAKRLLMDSNHASELFYADYEAGRAAHRYVPMELEGLLQSEQHFDLALTTHWMFSDHEDSFFQVQAIKRLLSVATELRIFPLLDHTGKMSASLGPVIALLQSEQIGVELRHVDFEHERFGNAMLRVWGTACAVSH
jgi:hypothetical protein